jgi:fructose/tagatose bisphosphate aldolase
MKQSCLASLIFALLSSFQSLAPARGNVANLVLLKAALGAADEVGVPLLVGASEGERHFFGTRRLKLTPRTPPLTFET